MELRFLGWTCAPLAIAGLLLAQDPSQPPDPQQVDPPSRVARLNYLNGTVSFRPGSQEDWAAATLNYPLTTGDHIWTDEQAGAEMHVGSAAFRLAGTTAFAVLTLDDHMAQVSLSQGFMNVRIRQIEDSENFEVDTPNGAVSLLGPGDYRVDVNPGANVTTVTVRAGNVEVNGGGQTFPVREGQQVRFSGADQLNAEPAPVPGPDPWDEWCLGRDQRDDQAEQVVSRYVGNNMIGAEDLAGTGEWRNDPAYGSYWVPTRVESGWAPYRYGHWAYVEPWGWTWIDDAPWGFAPFHYGRWAMFGGTWGWVPGTIVARPVYAPALVAFVGGAGFGAAVGIGGVAAWVPLGPREVYRPYYRVSDVYVTRVNYSHVRDIRVTNVTYVNRTYVTAVRQETFSGARPVSREFVRVPPSAVAHVERLDAVSYRPAREAYMGRPAGMRVPVPPREVVSRTVIVNHAPPRIEGRPQVVQYRPAPPVTRRMEAGPAGYRPSAGYGQRGTSPQTGYVPPRNAAPQPGYGQRGNAPAVYGRPGGTQPETRQVQHGNTRTTYGEQGGRQPQTSYGQRVQPNRVQPNTEAAHGHAADANTQRPAPAPRTYSPPQQHVQQQHVQQQRQPPPSQPANDRKHQ